MPIAPPITGTMHKTASHIQQLSHRYSELYQFT